MATQTKCSGTQTLSGWLSVGPACTYQVTLIIDGSAITNTVALVNTMTTAQIAALLNSNRVGNTTGTFTAQTVGNDLKIIITDIIIPNGAAGVYQITANGTGFPCGDFTLHTASLTCTITRTGGGGGRPYPISNWTGNKCVCKPR